MFDADLIEFERAFSRLCAGFDTPPTQARKDAYWQAFRKLSLSQFTFVVDAALTSARFESMPTVGGLRKLLDEPGASLPAQMQQGPSLQERLCGYVMRTRFPRNRDGKFSPDQMRQTGRSWTYLYREWTDGERKAKCAECTGVLVPPCGALPGFRVDVAEMLTDVEHARLIGNGAPA